LYIRTSGFQILCGGILKSCKPPNSEAFHLRFTSTHSNFNQIFEIICWFFS
ncbi:hypothetical protein X975_02219, partial [Stegodyphus mimosarum]